MKQTVIIIALLLLSVSTGGVSADAGLIVTIQDNLNGSVNYAISGELSAPPLGTAESVGNSLPASGSVSPASGSLLILGGNNLAKYDRYEVSIQGSFQAFGTGGEQVTTGVSSGDLFGFFATSGVDSVDIWLPTGYRGGDALSATGYWTGSLASLGLEEGLYQTVIEADQVPLGFDTVSINVTKAPEPGSLFVLGGLSLGFFGRRVRKRHACKP